MPTTGPAALELRKLYQELQARNRHNLEQSSNLAHNKELLNKRNAQVTIMDKRIGDLRERLHKKRAEAFQIGQVHSEYQAMSSSNEGLGSFTEIMAVHQAC
ncbi:unnamed protein product [Merluccius merluccius]